MRTTHIFNKTTNINLINQIHNQFNNHLSSLTTFNHLLLLLQLISTSSPLITTITQPSKQQPLIYGYFNNSHLIDSLFSKLVSFSTNITVIFFFSETFNSNLKFISTKNNQSIDQSTNTILKYLSLKKRSKCSNSIHPKFPHSSHTKSYLLWPITSIQSPKKLLCFSTTHCNFASQQIRSFDNHQNQNQHHHAHNTFILSVIELPLTSLWPNPPLISPTIFHQIPTTFNPNINSIHHIQRQQQQRQL